MALHMQQHRRSGASVAIAAAILITAGCGGAATQAPTPTPTVAPTPTATPFDVAKAFLAIVGDPVFSARMELDGSMEMGVSATLAGTITSSGEDSRTLTKIGFAGATVEIETISTGGKTYTRTAPGPWLEGPPPTGGSDDESMTEWLRTLSQIEDLGVETRNGRSLHHLSAGDEPVPLGVLGLDAAKFKDPVVTIDFYVEDDGTPAIMAIEGTWVQLIKGQEVTVEFTLDLTLTDVGAAISIDPPTDVWTTYTSPLGYSMAHPADFSVVNHDGYDAFVKDGADWIWVSTWPDATGLSTDGFRDALLDFVKDSWGDPTEGPTPTKLGGEAAYLATFNFPYDDGSDGIVYDVLAMHENLGWDVTLYTLPGEDARDFKLFQQFLTTFAFGG